MYCCFDGFGYLVCYGLELRGVSAFDERSRYRIWRLRIRVFLLASPKRKCWIRLLSGFARQCLGFSVIGSLAWHQIADSAGLLHAEIVLTCCRSVEPHLRVHIWLKSSHVISFFNTLPRFSLWIPIRTARAPLTPDMHDARPTSLNQPLRPLNLMLNNRDMLARLNPLFLHLEQEIA